MFDLPHSEQIDEGLDVSQGTIQPFENGYITTWVGRRKTPYGHRLVRAGRIIGWLCEGDSATKLLGGSDARKSLETAEEGAHRLVGYACSLRGLGSLATLIPEAFEFQADIQGLSSGSSLTDRLFARNISAVLSTLEATTTFKEHLQQIKEFSSIVQAIFQARQKNWLQASHLFLIR